MSHIAVSIFEVVDIPENHTILMFQDEHAPLPHVFTKVGWPVIMWIVTVGAVFALCTRYVSGMARIRY